MDEIHQEVEGPSASSEAVKTIPESHPLSALLIDYAPSMI